MDLSVSAYTISFGAFMGKLASVYVHYLGLNNMYHVFVS